MEATVKKWGNSLGFRIPKSFAIQAGVEDGSLVDIILDGDKLIISPKQKESNNIEELLMKVSDENKHEEFDSGESQGNEIW